MQSINFSKFKKILMIIISIILIFSLTSCLFGGYSSKSDTKKEAPKILKIEKSTELFEYYIYVTIKANDDYDKVKLKIELYNNNREIIDQGTIIEYDLEKGKTYKLKYYASSSVFEKCNYGEATIIQYT